MSDFKILRQSWVDAVNEKYLANERMESICRDISLLFKKYAEEDSFGVETTFRGTGGNAAFIDLQLSLVPKPSPKFEVFTLLITEEGKDKYSLKIDDEQIKFSTAQEAIDFVLAYLVGNKRAEAALYRVTDEA